MNLSQDIEWSPIKFVSHAHHIRIQIEVLATFLLVEFLYEFVLG